MRSKYEYSTKFAVIGQSTITYPGMFCLFMAINSLPPSHEAISMSTSSVDMWLMTSCL